MKVLVTGGGGFLGLALCRGLRKRGHQVVSFQRRHSPQLAELGVGQVRGDLADANAVAHAAAGVEAVFHNAAKAGAWGSYDSYHQANVVGTRNVLAACRAHGIGKLVYTSTPSVTHRATHPVEGLGADQVPYGENLQAAYAATKAIAEREVLAANDATLAVVALRPRLIWGPGDAHLLPRLVERARAGRLRQALQGADLVLHDGVDLVRRHIQVAPAEVSAVPIRWMCADADLVFFAQRDHACHIGRIAGMESAGDVRRGDVWHQRGIVLKRGFAQIGIQVDVSHRCSATSYAYASAIP